jgi:hypothetical protein
VLGLAAGWLNATFVALTMHGWWWPGRQVVVVAPLAVLAVAVWAGGPGAAAPARRSRLVAVAALGLAGLWSWAWLVVEVLADRRRLVVDFLATADPSARLYDIVLPDARRWLPADRAGWWIWCVALLGWAAWSWYRTERPEEDMT